jgi:hypothetical protein
LLLLPVGMIATTQTALADVIIDWNENAATLVVR